jgi:RNA polymerase sigma-70 factor (ECF subfamily)
MSVFTEPATAAALPDEELVEEVLRGNNTFFELLMRRYNQRVFRACRAILRNDSEAEDVAQDAYVRAYEHLRQFERRASFSTWLTRIAINEALARARRNGRREEIQDVHELKSQAGDPEQNASTAEARTLLEHSIDALPDRYRQVFVLRDVEEMSTIQTAQALDISEENVKTRLHRARALIRRELYKRAGATSTSAFHFLGERCDRLVRKVMARITVHPSEPISSTRSDRNPIHSL